MLSKTMMTRMPCAIVAPRVSFQAARRTRTGGETAGEDGPRAACSALLPFAVDVSSLSLSISVARSPSPGHASRAFAFLGCVVDKRRVLMRSEPEKNARIRPCDLGRFPGRFRISFSCFFAHAEERNSNSQSTGRLRPSPRRRLRPRRGRQHQLLRQGRRGKEGKGKEGGEKGAFAAQRKGEKEGAAASQEPRDEERARGR